MTGRKLLQRGHEGQTDALATYHRLDGIAILGDKGVGDRFDPGVVGQHVEIGQLGLPGRAHVHGTRPPRAAIEVVQADVGGNAVQPGLQR